MLVNRIGDTRVHHDLSDPETSSTGRSLSDLRDLGVLLLKNMKRQPKGKT